MSQKALPQQVLAYDLGGTKVAVGIVDRHGHVLEEKRVPVVIEKGKNAVLRQLIELGKDFLVRYPNVRRVGIASAGPLHSGTGTLLDPTNFTAKDGGTWGRVKVAAILGRGLKLPAILENDAAAAILAEKWVGSARAVPNAMILTLGTGLGTGVIVNGELVRAGRGMHPEGGHLIVNCDDPSAVCGCGNVGCAEAYLSGNGFARRFSKKYGKKFNGAEIADLARKKDPRALAAFGEYATILGAMLHNYVVIYEPDRIIFTGSFAAASDLFLKTATDHLKRMLHRRCEVIGRLPRLTVSKLRNQAGLIGGAYVAFFPPQGA